MMNTVNVMIVGVGGQGSLLASRLLGAAAEKAGYAVKMSEVHGMSQRGGSVVTYVRYGDEAYSPVIMEGEADYIIALEQLEAARFLPMLKVGGTVVASNTRIAPATVLRGAARYPEDTLEAIRSAGADIVVVDSLETAKSVGMPKAENAVLMGRFATISGIKKELWLEALEECVKPQFIEKNKRAFELGYSG